MNSISAENRNQMPIPLHRPRQTQTIRRCSLCRQSGHNITRCNSDRLLQFEAVCADAVVNINNPDDFQNWLRVNYGNDLLLLKAFCIRKLHITVRFSLNEYIHYVTEYIFRTYKNTPQIEEADDDSIPSLIEANINESFEENFNNVIADLTTIYNYEVTEETNFQMSLIRQYTNYLLFIFRSLPIRDEYFQDQSQRTVVLSVENNDENLNETCQCSICWDDKELSQFVKLDCNHEFCKDCVRQSVTSETRPNLHCALCRCEVRTMRLRTQEVHTELSEVFA